MCPSGMSERHFRRLRDPPRGRRRGADRSQPRADFGPAGTGGSDRVGDRAAPDAPGGLLGLPGRGGGHLLELAAATISRRRRPAARWCKSAERLAQLGIDYIPSSYFPEPCGRIERVFGTLQQRLPPSCGWPPRSRRPTGSSSNASVPSVGDPPRPLS
jgi:hypothetical protein